MIPLQEGLDVSVGGTNIYQLSLAIIVLVMAFIIITAIRIRSEYSGLPDKMKRDRSTFRSQLENQRPNILYIDDDEYEDMNVYEKSKEYLNRDNVQIEKVSPSEAWEEFRKPFADPVPEAPGLVVRLARLGVLVFVLGMMAVSTQIIVNALTSDPNYPSLSAILGEGQSTLGTIYETGGDILHQYPYLDTLWSLTYAYSIEGMLWLYNNWFITAMLLFMGAGGIWYLTKEIPDEEWQKISLNNPKNISLKILGSAMLVWFFGTGVSTILGLLEFQEAGNIVGFLVGIIVLGIYVSYAVKRFYKELVHLKQASSAGAHLSVYVVIRYISMILGILATPLVFAYLFVIIAEGKPIEIWNAFMQSSTDIKVLTLLVLGLVIAFVAQRLSTNKDNIYDLFKESLSRKQVRIVLFTRAFPLAVTPFGYIIVWSIGRSVIWATIAAVILGLAVFYVYKLFNRARYITSTSPSEAIVPGRLVIHFYKLHDSEYHDEMDELEEEEHLHYFAIINGSTEIARDNIDEMAQDIEDAAESLFEDGNIPNTVSQYYAKVLKEYGISDYDEANKKLKERVSRSILKELRDEEVVTESKIKRELRQYPEWVVESRLDTWQKRGIIRKKRGNIFLQRDPFKKGGLGSS